VVSPVVSRTVLITGCSSGFGRATVGEFLARGWTVLATGRDAETRPRALEAEARHHRGRLCILSLDITDAGQRERVTCLVRKARRLDCLVNNAGFGLFGALEELAPAQIRHQMEVNFFGAVFLTRTLLPYLRQSRGRVINVSSVFGYAGFPLTSLYCASKFALEGLTEALWHELRPHGVQVSLVEPGGHRTRFAANVEWGTAGVPGGAVYARQTQGYRWLLRSLASRRGAPPEAVARRIVALASAKRMPMRSRVGLDAQVVHLARKLLPERVTGWLLAAACDRALGPDRGGLCTSPVGADDRCPG
jgi:NAD(P)-dependent dehydrogenase (short-subunit alcohol dehydrogenase family)